MGGRRAETPRSFPKSRTSASPFRGLRRERLDDLLGRVWRQRAALVVAPAGSGKTTLLQQFVALSQRPVAWFRAEASDGSPEGIVFALREALSPVMSARLPAVSSVEDLAVVLERPPAESMVLVIDDLHTLQGSRAEPVLERFLECLPENLHLLMVSRCVPGFNLSRLRVSGGLVEIGPDDLRFRSWEVEHLFREVYDKPLGPGDVVELTSRMEGWAAGLQLFHLATRDKTVCDRQSFLQELGARSRMVREYLARNVLDDLPRPLRDFLVATSVLGRLTGPLCDELLRSTGSAQILQHLERQQIFTGAVGDGHAYRYHEVLRSHLEATLVEQVGESEARIGTGGRANSSRPPRRSPRRSGPTAGPRTGRQPSGCWAGMGNGSSPARGHGSMTYPMR